MHFPFSHVSPTVHAFLSVHGTALSSFVSHTFRSLHVHLTQGSSDIGQSLSDMHFTGA
jgi:hypothetical protein